MNSTVAILLLLASGAVDARGDDYKIDLSEFGDRAAHSTAKMTEDLPSERKSLLLLSANSWSPDGLLLESRLSDITRFEKNSMPSFELLYVSPPLLTRSWGNFSGRLGLGATVLERNGKLASGEIAGMQNGYLIPLEIGVQFSPQMLKFKSLQVYLSEGIAPTIFLSQRSVHDDGTTQFGLASHANLGAEIPLKRVLFGNDLELDVHGSWIVGSLDGNSLGGFGVAGGIGILL